MGSSEISKLEDRAYLIEQYRNATNLDARIRLHECFSTNREPWFPWYFDLLNLPPQARILELGCGSGKFWIENLRRVPPGWEITLSDVSPGMLADARAALPDDGRFTFEAIDAQSIPHPDGSFDAVMANHMLYHVPDRPTALSEIRRVLRPGGTLYAATNGENHMRELDELMRSVDPSTPSLDSSGFSLQNGQAQLSPWFSEIATHRREDSLLITEAEPLVAYVLSSIRSASLVQGDALEDFRQRVQADIASQGAIHVTKETGVFQASA